MNEEEKNETMKSKGTAIVVRRCKKSFMLWSGSSSSQGRQDDGGLAGWVNLERLSTMTCRVVPVLVEAEVTVVYCKSEMNG